jgi:thiol-disulfide isomerase/thioredoxin
MALVVVAVVPRIAAEPRSGFWLAHLTGQNGDLPFRMCMGAVDGKWAARIQNGDEVLTFSVMLAGVDSVVVDLTPYPSEIRARLSKEGRHLEGTWTRRFSAQSRVEIAFHAEWRVTTRECFSDPDVERGATWSDFPRFEREANGPPPLPPGSVEGRWSVAFEGEAAPAVALLKQEPSGEVTGTILTVTGDYRYLEGVIEGNQLSLSTFDGSHAYLFQARLQQDGTLDGDFWSYGKWGQTWTAHRNPKAQLPDPLGLARWNKKTRLEDLVFPDVDGKPHSLADPEFAGKARLLVLSGSWCPNCSDATQHMIELDRTYRERGLRVIGICIEMGNDFAGNARQVRRYVQKYSIPYPVLVAPMGKHMSESFPALQPLFAIPTFVFLDGKGHARCVYTGYSGPAAGAENVRLREKFDALVKELLAGD